VIGYNLSFPISITTHNVDVDIGWWSGLIPLNTYSGRCDVEIETRDEVGYKVLLLILVGLIDRIDRIDGV
jgi:hypothetical protein